MSNLPTYHLISLITYFPNDLSILIVDYVFRSCFLDKKCKCNNPIAHLDAICKYSIDGRISQCFDIKFVFFEGNSELKARKIYTGYIEDEIPAVRSIHKHNIACLNCGEPRLIELPHYKYICNICNWTIQMDYPYNGISLVYANIKHRYKLINGKDLIID